MGASFATKNKVWLHLAFLAAAILIAYSKIFHAGLAGYDMEYVIENRDVSSINLENIAAWFSRFYIGNYHPLTIFSYAVDYMVGGQNPLIYHFTNLLIHACNTVVLYFFINRIQQNKTTGFFVALIFAVHPLQTESVSCIAERKTILCTFFYLLALLRYITYVHKPVFKNLALVCLFGIAAMLSKAVAVALPLTLFAIDIWLQRPLTGKKIWLEKTPLFVCAIVIGIIAIKAQEEGKFLGMHTGYNWFDAIIFAACAYVQYIVHLLAPVHLSVIYPYPAEIGFVQYLCLFIAIAILALAFIAYRRKWYILCGGIIFYSVNIFLLLKFIQFGEALMADRYVYIAGIGILFPAVYYPFVWLQKRSKEIIAVITGSCIAAAFLCMTFLRNDVWLSDFNFFSAILETFPGSVVAQYSIGGLYMRQGDFAEAEKHIDLAVQLDPGNYKAWYNKGALYLRERKPEEALDALNRCLALKDYPKAYFSRALLYQATGKPDLALADIEKTLADQPGNAKAYYIKADCLEQQGHINEAIDNYNKAIQYNSNEPLFFIRRGLAYAKTKQMAAAQNDLETAVALNPDNGEALYFRGLIKSRNGGNPCDDFRNALRHGYKQAQQALAGACGQ